MRDREAVDSNIRRKEDDGDDRQNAKKKKKKFQFKRKYSVAVFSSIWKNNCQSSRKKILKKNSPPLNYDFFNLVGSIFLTICFFFYCSEILKVI